jgi:hypothetical protein
MRLNSFTPEPSHASLPLSLPSCVPERGEWGKRWGVKDIPEFAQRNSGTILGRQFVPFLLNLPGKTML